MPTPSERAKELYPENDSPLLAPIRRHEQAAYLKGVEQADVLLQALERIRDSVRTREFNSALQEYGYDAALADMTEIAIEAINQYKKG